MTSYLLPIADREPLAWIVAEQRTAFASHRQREAERLAEGDRLFLYATRGCFRNPTRDRGRIIGIARVTRPAARLRSPVTFGDREYPMGIKIAIRSLAPKGEGVELAPLVPTLESFPDASSWSARMRRPLVPLSENDAARLDRELRKIAVNYRDAAETYAL